MSDDELKKTILDFMKTQKFCVISTVSKDGKPEAALIGFSETPELEITFGTSNQSRKFKNLQSNQNVAFEIGSGEPRITIQYEGVAQPFDKGVFEKTGKFHLTKLPDSSKYVGKSDQVWFKVTPTWIRFTDSRTDHTAVYELEQF